ncbi:hypothetical protein [Nocardia thailandica]
MPDIFTYFRRALVGEEFEDAVAEYAATYGIRLRQVRQFAEGPSPVAVLWTVLTTMDRAHGTRHAPRITGYARSRGTDIAVLVEAPAPCPALWNLIEAATSSPAALVLVPSVDHLAGLGAPASVVEQVLRAIPTAELVYLNLIPTSRS